MFKDGPRQRRLRPQILRQFAAQLMTDDERAAFHGLGEGCRMREGAKIYAPENFRCGRFVWIGENARLDASGGLEIGDHVTIGTDVLVWSHANVLASLLRDNRPGSPLLRRRRTRIGDGCFIGGPAVIYAGVTLGPNTVVLPMSVVTRDFAGHGIIGGAPAKRLMKIDAKYLRTKLAELGPLPAGAAARARAAIARLYK